MMQFKAFMILLETILGSTLGLFSLFLFSILRYVYANWNCRTHICLYGTHLEGFSTRTKMGTPVYFSGMQSGPFGMYICSLQSLTNETFQ